DGKTSLVVRSAKGTTMGPGSAEPKRDARIVQTDAHSLQTLMGFGPGGATLAQWERAVDRANDTFYKSRDRLVKAGKVSFDAETACYVTLEPSGSPVPGVVH